jgi:hypothetical protein
MISFHKFTAENLCPSVIRPKQHWLYVAEPLTACTTGSQETHRTAAGDAKDAYWLQLSQLTVVPVIHIRQQRLLQPFSLRNDWLYHQGERNRGV